MEPAFFLTQSHAGKKQRHVHYFSLPITKTVLSSGSTTLHNSSVPNTPTAVCTQGICKPPWTGVSLSPPWYFPYHHQGTAYPIPEYSISLS